MKFINKIAAALLIALIQIPCAGFAAEEDKELALIAAEQEKSDEEKLNDINPALTESISTERKKETDKEIKERKKKLKQTRKEKEKANERKLEESRRRDTPRREEPSIVIDPTEPIVEPPAPEVPSTPPPVYEPEPQPEPIPEPETNYKPIYEPPPVVPQVTEIISVPEQKNIYANFEAVARAAHFIPLYMPKKSGYEITALYAEPGVVEVRYGRKWEPTVSLAVRTHKRADGEPLKDISGVTGVKWRVDTSTGTTIYIAKISETQHVAAWAVGHYTFSARAENLSFAGFHSLVADELVELSTHYYLDL